MKKRLWAATVLAAVAQLVPSLPGAQAGPPTRAQCSLTTAQAPWDTRGVSWEGTLMTDFQGDASTTASRVTCWIQYHTAAWNGPGAVNVAPGTTVSCHGVASAACGWHLTYRAPSGQNHFLCGQYQWADASGSHQEAIDNDANAPGAQCAVITPNGAYGSNTTATAYRGGTSEPIPVAPVSLPPGTVPGTPVIGGHYEGFCDSVAQQDQTDPQQQTWVATTYSGFTGTAGVTWEVTCWLQTAPDLGAEEIPSSRHTCSGTEPAGYCTNPFVFQSDESAVFYQCQHVSWQDPFGVVEQTPDHDPATPGIQCRPVDQFVVDGITVLDGGPDIAGPGIGGVPGIGRGGGGPGGGGPGGGRGVRPPGIVVGDEVSVGDTRAPRGFIIGRDLDSGGVSVDEDALAKDRPEARCDYNAVKDPDDTQGQTWLLHKRVAATAVGASEVAAREFEATCWLQTEPDLAAGGEIANTRITCGQNASAGVCDGISTFQINRSQSVYLCLHLAWTGPETASGEFVAHLFRDVFGTGGVTTLGGTADIVAAALLAANNLVATATGDATTYDETVDYDESTPGVQCKLVLNV